MESSRKDLQFTNKLHTKDDNNIAKRTLNNKVILGVKDLKSECSQIAKEVNIKEMYWIWQSKKSIKNAVKEANIKETNEAVKKTRRQMTVVRTRRRKQER